MKTKLLFIFGSMNGGGAERVLLDLLSNLDYSRYEVDLCLIISEGILLPEVPRQVRIISLWKSYTLYYKIALRASTIFRNQYLFKRILNKKIKDVYDVEISFIEGVPLKLHAIRRSDARKFTWVHIDLFNFHYTRNLFFKGEELAAYNQMDAVISVSKNTQKAFEKRCPQCTSDKLVIYNPIDIKKIKRMANEVEVEREEELKRKDVFTIVAIGRLTPQKRMDRLFRLATRLKKEERKIKIQLIGDGELKEKLLLLRKELGVEKEVEMCGFLHNPFPLLKRADLLVSCSAHEGFGLSLCEAMALGVPVVSTKTAGPMEIIGDNEFGLLCEQDDESIYQAIKRMMDDELLREEYSKKGLERAQDFSVEKMIKDFNDLVRG